MSAAPLAPVPVPLATPDPIRTTESITIAVVALLSNAYVLFVSSGMTDAQKSGLASTITGVWVVGQFLYSAYVRANRAKAGVLVTVRPGEALVVPATPVAA